VYSRRDVEVLALVRHLLHDLRYTIDGARKVLRERGIEEALGEARKSRQDAGFAVATEIRRALHEAVDALGLAATRLEVPLPLRRPPPTRGHEGVAKGRRSG
jgi:DNA-binding transcriptional MerR regulator